MAVELHRSRANSLRRCAARIGLWLLVALTAFPYSPLLASPNEVRAVLRAIRESQQLCGGSRYGEAERRLLAVRDEMVRAGEPKIEAGWLSARGSALWGMGRYDESLGCYERAAVLLREAGDAYEEAVARSNVALLTASILPLPWADAQKERVRGLVLEALAAARRGGNRRVEAKSLLYLAQLADGAAECRRLLDRVLSLPNDSLAPRDRRLALRLLAESLVLEKPENPAKGFLLLDEAEESAREDGDPDAIARAAVVRSNLKWELGRRTEWTAGSREEAIANSLAALASIEEIRALQADPLVRARCFGPWAFVYRRFAGRLLWPSGEPAAPEDAALAFQVLERMRARTLLERLDAAQVAELTGADLPDLAAPYGAEPPTPATAQAALLPGEALLSFQVAERRKATPGGVFRGGSWLFVSTREGTKVYPLPERHELEDPVELLLGLISARDGSEARGAVRLFDLVLRRALSELPASVDRLVIVPDGPLNRVPFGLLRENLETRPLNERYAISLEPSVAVWLRCRNREPARGRAWLIGDPRPLPEVETAARVASGGDGPTSGSAGTREPLGDLPYALWEVRSARRRLGAGTRCLVGGAATESRLKSVLSEAASMVHLATHVIVDNAHPERSAVLLAPGGGDDDGLLHFREVLPLDLSGSVVVLSGCRSASGTLIEGEGVLGPAWAFLAAGARAVIGGRWELRDDEAALLVDAFHRRLAEGADLTSALQGARRERAEAGAPAAAWAGLVLVGDGEFAPLAGGRRRVPAPSLLLTLAGLGLALVATAQALRLDRHGH